MRACHFASHTLCVLISLFLSFPLILSQPAITSIPSSVVTKLATVLPTRLDTALPNISPAVCRVVTQVSAYTIQCNNDEILISGGATCPSISKGLQTNLPTYDGTTYGWGALCEGPAGVNNIIPYRLATLTAICCKVAPHIKPAIKIRANPVIANTIATATVSTSATNSAASVACASDEALLAYGMSCNNDMYSSLVPSTSDPRSLSAQCVNGASLTAPTQVIAICIPISISTCEAAITRITNNTLDTDKTRYVTGSGADCAGNFASRSTPEPTNIYMSRTECRVATSPTTGTTGTSTSRRCQLKCSDPTIYGMHSYGSVNTPSNPISGSITSTYASTQVVSLGCNKEYVQEAGIVAQCSYDGSWRYWRLIATDTTQATSYTYVSNNLVTQICAPRTRGNSCSGHGNVAYNATSYYCICDAGYTGITCSTTRCGDGITASSAEECDYGVANRNPSTQFFTIFAACTTSCRYLSTYAIIDETYQGFTLIVYLPQISIIAASMNAQIIGIQQFLSLTPAEGTNIYTDNTMIPIMNNGNATTVQFGVLRIPITFPSTPTNGFYIYSRISYSLQLITNNTILSRSSVNKQQYSAAVDGQYSYCGCTFGNPKGDPQSITIFQDRTGRILITLIPSSVCHDKISITFTSPIATSSQLIDSLAIKDAYQCRNTITNTRQVIDPNSVQILGERRTYTITAKGGARQQYVDGASFIYPDANVIAIDWITQWIGVIGGIVTGGNGVVSDVIITVSVVYQNGTLVKNADGSTSTVTTITTSTGLFEFSDAQGFGSALRSSGISSTNAFVQITASKRTGSVNHTIIDASPGLQNQQVNNFQCTAAVKATVGFCAIRSIGTFASYPVTGTGSNYFALKDTSVYTLSGRVLMKFFNTIGTGCPSIDTVITARSTLPVAVGAAPSAPISTTVDPITGEWSLAITIDDTVNLTVSLPGTSHTFIYDGSQSGGITADPRTTPIHVTSSIANLNFYDTTTTQYQLAVVGNQQCQLPLGSGKILLNSPLSGCTLSMDATFSGATFTPTTVPAMTMQTSIPQGYGLVTPVASLTSSMRTEINAAITQQLSTIDFRNVSASGIQQTIVYTTSPVIQVKQAADCASGVSSTTGTPLDNLNTPFYVMRQNRPINMTFKIYEAYGNGADRICSQVTRDIIIQDGISGPTQPITCPDTGCRVRATYNNLTREATVTYQFYPGTLSIIPATDSTPATLIPNIATVQIDGSIATPITITAVIIGQKLKSDGAFDVVSIPVSDPLLIVRDPPGGMSYAEMTSGTSMSYQTNLKTQDDLKTAVDVYAGVGVDAEVSFCGGVAVGGLAATCTQIGKSQIRVGVENTFSAGTSDSTGTHNAFTFTMSQTVSTSQDPGIINGAGDMFLIPSTAIVFRESWETSVNTSFSANTCGIGVRSSFQWLLLPAGNNIITFISAHEIATTIATITSTLTTNTSLTFTQSTLLSNARDKWQDILATNDNLKNTSIPWSTVHQQGLTDPAYKVPTWTGSSFGSGGITSSLPAGFNTNSMLIYGGGGQTLAFEYTFELNTEVESEQVITLDNEFVAKLESENAIVGVVVTANLDTTLSTVFTTTSTKTSTTDNTITIRYVLGDPNVDDRFNVQVLRDPVYGTPVFRTLSGSSKCPHEAHTVAREDVTLRLSSGQASQINGLDHVATALFNLDIINQAEATGIQIQQLLQSDAAGALVFLSGVNLLTNTFQTSVAPGVTRAVVSVQRQRDYDFTIRIGVSSQCENALTNGVVGDAQAVPVGNQIALQVNYQHDCPAVAFGGDFRRLGTFTVSSADLVAGGSSSDRTLSIPLINPEFGSRSWRSEMKYKDPNSRLQSIQIRYRPTGLLGDAGWINIIPSTINVINASSLYDEYTYQWPLPSSGSYQLQAYSICTQGITYSSVITGTIDIIPPQQFGFPKPTLLTYLPGDEISVSFTEPVVCLPGAVTALSIAQNIQIDLGNLTRYNVSDVTQTKLSFGSTTTYYNNLLITCVDNTIRINFPSTLDYDQMSNQRIIININNAYVSDVVGNKLQNGISWWFIAKPFDLKTIPFYLTGLHIEGANFDTVTATDASKQTFLNALLNELALFATQVLRTPVTTDRFSITQLKRGSVIVDLGVAPGTSTTSPSSYTIVQSIVEGMNNASVSKQGFTYLNTVTQPDTIISSNSVATNNPTSTPGTVTTTSTSSDKIPIYTWIFLGLFVFFAVACLLTFILCMKRRDASPATQQQFRKEELVHRDAAVEMGSAHSHQHVHTTPTPVPSSQAPSHGNGHLSIPTGGQGARGSASAVHVHIHDQEQSTQRAASATPDQTGASPQ